MADDRITFLINNLSERQDIEVKNWLSGLQDAADKAKLAKEIIALANNGGGDIFIGFDDKGKGHPGIQPQPGELEAFTQDSIAGLIHRYANPPFQCQIGFYKREGCDITHPVITVPGNHRTPIMAKSGSPDQKTLQTSTVYVRRPGGSSEQATTQDDWEKLLDRLVRARRDEMLDAIRNVLNPPANVEAPDVALESWNHECSERWRGRIRDLPDGHEQKHESGYWTVSFLIEGVTNNLPIAELKKALESEMPSYSGSPPFAYERIGNKKPRPNGDLIEAWYSDAPGADYWCIANDGRGFMLRGMQEDSSTYCMNRSPRPQGPSFDRIFPTYNMTEVLKFLEALAGKFTSTDSCFRLLLRYHGTKGRRVRSSDIRYWLHHEAECLQPTLQAKLDGEISGIDTTLPELVHSLLAPIYQQFDFTELPKALVNSVVKDALEYRSY